MEHLVFTKEMKEKAVHFLEKISPDAVCSYCQGDVWEIAEEIFITETITDSGLAHPYVVIMCKKCTNTKFFNAIAMGILET